MAIDPTAYGLTQWVCGILLEDTTGTVETTSLQLMNIVGIPTVSRNPVRDFEPRHGTGRVAKKGDFYVNDLLQEKEISMTIFYDQTVAPILYENAVGAVVDATPAAFEVAYNYTGGAEITHGETAIADNTKTLTVGLQSPETNMTELFPGCVVSSLRTYADAATDGGRFYMDVTFKTRYPCDVSNAALTTPVAHVFTYQTIYDLQGASGVATLNGVDVVVAAIEWTLENNIKFFGYDASGNPECGIRGLPEFLATGSVTVKYDANTGTLIAHSIAETDIEFLFHDNAWASATFGVKGDYGQILEDLNPADLEGAAFLTVPLKFGATTSGNVFAIVP